MTKRTESVAWECLHCGHRHMWRWEFFDCDMAATPEAIAPMWICDKCSNETIGRLAVIGRHAWAVIHRALSW